MKTRLVTVFLTLFTSVAIKAQTEFGVKGGVNITFFKVLEDDFGTRPDTEIGFYGGVYSDINIENSFHLQPELLFIGVKDFEFINAPIYLKYYINDDFHILVGPSLNYFFDFFSNKFKIRADLGLGYNLLSDLGLHIKYTIGFEELSPNILFLGLNYKL